MVAGGGGGGREKEREKGWVQKNANDTGAEFTNVCWGCKEREGWLVGGCDVTFLFEGLGARMLVTERKGRVGED